MAKVKVDTRRVRVEVMAVVERWDMGPEQAAMLIAAVERGLNEEQVTIPVESFLIDVDRLAATIREEALTMAEQMARGYNDD